MVRATDVFPIPCTNERDRFEFSSESNDILDQLLASKAVPRHWGRQFSVMVSTLLLMDSELHILSGFNRKYPPVLSACSEYS